jgi:BirA family biotin operon repressor/biotin-[acetyl-CoA-carboxylase] ligase
LDITDAILRVLYKRRERFVERDELARASGVGPGRLDEALARLDEGGWAVESSPPHGLRLVRPVKPHAALIEDALGTRRVGRHAICFDEVDSTNDVAWDSARQAEADGVAVLAEQQRRGRGRLGRRWASRPGAAVLMSVLLTDAAGALAHEALTIAAGLAAAEGIDDACGLRCGLKWPNDVLLDGAKAAGVLVEMRQAGTGRQFVVGMGINVNAAPPRGEVGAPAACLADHLAEPVERVEVARAVLRRLDGAVALVERGRLGPLREAWLARCGMVNERVRLLADGREHVGRVLDVSPLEGLVVCCDDGRTVHFPAVSTTIL